MTIKEIFRKFPHLHTGFQQYLIETTDRLDDPLVLYTHLLDLLGNFWANQTDLSIIPLPDRYVESVDGDCWVGTLATIEDVEGISIDQLLQWNRQSEFESVRIFIVD